jgi:hypothetical protein
MGEHAKAGNKESALMGDCWLLKKTCIVPPFLGCICINFILDLIELVTYFCFQNEREVCVCERERMIEPAYLYSMLLGLDGRGEDVYVPVKKKQLYF